MTHEYTKSTTLLLSTRKYKKKILFMKKNETMKMHMVDSHSIDSFINFVWV